MKKISLITIFDNPNFGTYLQALALGIVIKHLGAEIEIVHYERPTWHKYSKLFRMSSLYRGLILLKAYLKNDESYLQRYKCRKFVEKYIKVCGPYFSYTQLCNHPPKADIYLTGSDQVWNTTHNKGIDKSYYLGYAPSGAKKVAYGASIGMSEIPNEYQDETKRLLSLYYAISVREALNVSILKNMGIDSCTVLDPTLLLNKDEWDKYVNKKINIEKPYILVYSVESKERDKEVGLIARNIANAKSWDVIEVNYFGPNKQIPYCDKHFYYATPDIFITLISQASFVVVSSFHGTVFSINYNKQFITVAPDRFSSRIDGILKMTGLTKRKIISSQENYLGIVNENIDFTNVNFILKQERKKSFDFINEKILNNL